MPSYARGAPNIRPAASDDVDALVLLGARMHAESAYCFLPYNPEKVRRLLLDYLSDSDSCCVFVAEAGGKAVGVIAGSLSDYYFCDETIASDTALFVAPAHRSLRTAAGLIRAFRAWAQERGARELHLGVSSDVNTERTGRLYERLGLNHVGGNFKQRLQGGAAR